MIQMADVWFERLVRLEVPWRSSSRLLVESWILLKALEHWTGFRFERLMCSVVH
jgi:hypothetical protein